jgi:hypothetical protein
VREDHLKVSMTHGLVSRRITNNTSGETYNRNQNPTTFPVQAKDTLGKAELRWSWLIDWFSLIVTPSDLPSEQNSLVDKALDYRPKGTGFDPRLDHKRRST